MKEHMALVMVIIMVVGRHNARYDDAHHHFDGL